MSNRKWKFKKLLRKRYGREIWIVKRRDGTKGYLKIPFISNKNKYRLLVANEYIAAYLARKLGLPVSKLKEISVKGPGRVKKRGLLSIKAKAKEVIPWKKAQFHNSAQIERKVKKAELLAQLIAFDAWILNLDRTNHNLILHRNHPRRRYNWYLIDHGIALFGSPSKWKKRWSRKTYKKPRTYEKTLHSKKSKKSLPLRIPKGLKRYTLQHRSYTEAMVQKISSLSKREIDNAIKKVPKGYLKRAEKAFIRNMLLKRQKHIQQIVEEIFTKLQKQTVKKSKTRKNGPYLE